MAYKITWSDKSLEDVSLIISYLSENWSQASVDLFKDKLIKQAMQLSFYPQIGASLSRSPNIRYVLISKQNMLYYEIYQEEKEVVMISIVDTRQNPNKNPFL